MSIKQLIVVILLLLSGELSWSQYSIKGKVNMSGDWQHQIYLATIDKLDDYYGAKAEHIVATAAISPNGKFVLSGDNLPSDRQYYRLYLIKEEQSEFNACMFMVGEEHNFIHLILDNNTQVELMSDDSTFAPFGDYHIVGDRENISMKSLANLVYPSYQFYEIKFPSELQFSQNKLNKDLFHFADTCSSPLVSLAAIINTDFDGYFNTNHGQYVRLGEILSTELKNHNYTKDYFRKLRYYGEDNQDQTGFWKLLVGLLSLLCLRLFFQNIRLRKKNQYVNSSPSTDPSEIQLTNQETKILELIKKGNSNKEIAAELFIGLSTVKTHINKLYAKLGVSTRKEAIHKVKS